MSKIKRFISVFNKDKEDLFEEIDVSFLELEKLREIFKPGSDDIEMYFVYPIYEHEASLLNNEIKINFDFNNYLYQLDCFNISPH